MSIKKPLEDDTLDLVLADEIAWIESILEDETMLNELNLPTDLTPQMKETVKQILLRDFENFLIGKNLEDEASMDIYDETKTPVENFVGMAMKGMEPISKMKKLVKPEELEIGCKYEIVFPNGQSAIVTLSRIVPNTFGDDYIFRNVVGAEDLVSKARTALIGKDEFPLPYQLLSKTKFLLII